MQTLTVQMLIDGWQPEMKAGLYVWRDGKTIFYVGQSKDVHTRVMAYLGCGMGKGWGIGTQVWKLIQDNYPQSLSWSVDFYLPREVDPRIPDVLHPQNIRVHLQGAEDILIDRLRPCCNSHSNRNGFPLPERYYKSDRVVNEAVILDL